MPPIHLCIGAPRSGMTWIFETLRQHRDLFVPGIKEIRYWNSRRSDSQRDAMLTTIRKEMETRPFCADQSAWLDAWSKIARDDAATAQTYTQLMSQSGRASLDISPSYCLLPQDQIRDLRATLPAGSKVIYLMSDPLDRLVSQVRLHFHQQGAYRGQPSHDDLAQFLNMPQQQRRWDYAAVIKDWTAEFGDDFVALPCEANTDATELRHRILRALDLDPTPQATEHPAAAFFPTEKNEAGQIWVTPLGRREKKQIAQAMLPAITDFAKQMPDAGTLWCTKLQKVADYNVTPSGIVADIDLATQKLMRMTESIGDNCEYGMWQRHRGYEPSSLFRWAITPISSLLDFLDAPAPLYAKEDLSVHSPGMVNDAKFGFKFHSKLVEPDGEGKQRLLADEDRFDAIHADEYAKIVHLQAKTFIQMRRQTALYIIKDNKGLAEDDVRRVLAHLHHHNPTHHLLWVEAGGDPSFVDAGGGLLRGSLPAFAPYVDVHAYVEGGWTALMTQLNQYYPIAAHIARMQR